MFDYKLDYKFDYNCDVAQSYGQNYKINEYNSANSELETAKYASSINIAAGFHGGDAVSIRRALLFAKEHNVALGAHIGFNDIQGYGKRKIELEDEELEAIIVYQIGAIQAYSKTFDLQIENVRCHGALKDLINEDENKAFTAIKAIKKVSPWLNFIVQSPKIRDLAKSLGLMSALEVNYSDFGGIEEIQNLQKAAIANNSQENLVDTIHFQRVEDIKKAYELLKPTPINYNRVEKQI